MARYALVIGIARYEHLRSLPKAAVDAEAIAQILENQYLYRVTRLPRKASEVDEARFVVAPHKHLSRKRLSQELNDFFRQRARNHDVFVYIAGHGLCVEDDLNGELTRYLALSDSDENGNNAIVFNTLSQFIGESDLSSLVMLIDCCYSNPK